MGGRTQSDVRSVKNTFDQINMFDLPFHPIVVHLPIAIGCLLPLLMIFNVITIQRFQWPVKTWWMIVLLQVIFLITSIVAVQTGEYDEETGRAPLVSGLSIHEEWGEKVPIAATVMLILSFSPILIPSKSTRMMVICIFASFGVILLLIQTGHTGGKLIYSRSTTIGNSLNYKNA